jgi:ribonuclease HII
VKPRTGVSESDPELRATRGPLLAGIDEAGRGPLAGPVVAACVILPGEGCIEGLADSKVLTPERRESLFVLIRERAVAWAWGQASSREIDRWNIHRATLLAMRRATQALSVQPDFALVDGLHVPRIDCPAGAMVDGDAKSPSVSAASIVAKVLRDHMLDELDQQYPVYGFSHNKGYGTPEHVVALRAHGPTPVHRRSFAPVWESMLLGLGI